MISQFGSPKILTGTAGSAFVRTYLTNAQGFSTFARQVTFHNEDASNNLLVSLDGGTTSVALKPGTERTFTGPFVEFSVKASASTVAWTAIASLA